jgi:hypothetical protein
MSRPHCGGSAWSLGLTFALLLAGVSCGPTNTTSKQPAGGSAGSLGAMTGGESQGATGGASAMNGGAGSGSGGGKAGAPSLPPDGDVPPAAALSKLDLLLMIDNSRNTAEKQRLLADAVTWLLTSPEAPPLSADDIHVGVITSSLGSHGASGANDVCVVSDDNDRAHLVATMRPGVPTFKELGFLAWGPDPEASATLDDLASGLNNVLATVGAIGCGYEASLEAWYRFLVDPEPPLDVVMAPTQATAELQGVDQVILSQRAEFLRPDSVLAIVALSDENDCSIIDGGYGWLISRASPMFRSTSACEVNPNDPCCQSCGEQNAKPGCPAIAQDSACSAGQFLDAATDEDDLNLRCFEQKRRFGFDLLHPISRYTDALTRQFQFNRAGEPVKNPLFVGNQRHPSQVLYLGIVGVPWQDLADDASVEGPGLTYLTAGELAAKERWAMMVGDPDASPPVPPTDPFMIESSQDRSTLSIGSAHPLLPGVSLVGSGSLDPQANVINGHESVNGSRELQYACTFPLAEPKQCDQAALEADESCQCFDNDVPSNRALCQPPGGGVAGITQHYDGAYPGIRHLRLLASLGDTAVAASACPKETGDTLLPEYGYRPAMSALGGRIEQALAAE